MARCLNGGALNRIIGLRRIRMTQFASPTSPRPSGAAPSRPPALRRDRFSFEFPIIALGAAMFAPVSGPAFAQNGDLADVRAQIKRYGCDLPQYATSVAGCKKLHAQAKALGATDSAATYSYTPSPSTRSAYRSRSSSSYYRRKSSRQPPSSGGSLFGFLFSSPHSYQTRPTSRDYLYSPAPSYGYGFRTMCVRMCDGYYWPISTSTVRGRFQADAQKCESSCNAPTKLFYVRGIGTPAEFMIDLEGKPYAQMPKAFLYREKFLPDCRCKPDPWSKEAKSEYQQREVAEAATDTGDVEPPAITANEAVRAAPPPVRRKRVTRKPRRRGWSSFFPFGRWSSGS